MFLNGLSFVFSHTYKWLATKKHFIICGYFINPSDAVTLQPYKLNHFIV